MHNHPTGINDDRDEADATHTTAGDEARATSARRAGGFACMSRVASSWRSSGARLSVAQRLSLTRRLFVRNRYDATLLVTVLQRDITTTTMAQRRKVKTRC
jgi:hypothetical protein